MAEITDKAAQSAWLAKHVMGMYLRTHLGDVWWHEGPHPAYPVAHWDPDYPVWAPFEIIDHAEMVLGAMVAAGWHWTARGCLATHFCFLHAGRDARGEALADTLAAAICNAAGAALGWPFGKEES